MVLLLVMQHCYNFRVSFLIFITTAVIMGAIGSLIAIYCFYYTDNEQSWVMHVAFVEGVLATVFLELISIAVSLSSVILFPYLVNIVNTLNNTHGDIGNN